MKKGEKGYSLIEVLAAFAIISIAILPIMSMYPAIFKQNKSASEIEEASRISLTIIDYIKAVGYTELSKERIGKTYVPITSGNRTGYKVYPLTKSGDSFMITSNQLDKDLGYIGGAATQGVIFLNSKGLNLKNETVIAVKIAETNVDVTGTTKYVDPVTGTTKTVMYGENTDKFITGRVIIGWGKAKTPISTPATKQERDQNVVEREKSYGVDFVITPKLKN